MIAGMTVLPRRSTRRAPAGTCTLPASANLREAMPLTTKRRILDRRASIADDEPRAFEDRDGIWSLGREQTREKYRSDDCQTVTTHGSSFRSMGHESVGRHPFARGEVEYRNL